MFFAVFCSAFCSMEIFAQDDTQSPSVQQSDENVQRESEPSKLQALKGILGSSLQSDPAAEIDGEMPGTMKNITPNLIYQAVKSFSILVGGVLFFLLLKVGILKFNELITEKEAIRESDTTLRLKTLSGIVYWAGSIFITLSVLYMILDNFGINMAPLIAGAGIAGLAFGFGGQYLIRDIINGIFILLEGQYHVGDVIKVGEHGGLVESVNLRVTILRDLEGRVIYIPNGEIKSVINMTKEWSRALLSIGVAYKENVDHVMDVIKEIGKEMRRDPNFAKLILDDLQMLGVDSFDDSQVTIRCFIKTLPIKQWDVAREFRRRLKNRFDELGIEIPFPHRTIYWGSAKDNLFRGWNPQKEVLDKNPEERS